MRRPRHLISAVLLSILLLACSFGCGSSRDAKLDQSGSASTDMPELTDEMIRERINDTRVRDVPEENGTTQPISWSFGEDEPKEITIVDKQIEATHATIVLDIKTSSPSRAREPRYLAGQIRTTWELRSGWVLRKWEIVKTENISMKYKNLPKPSPQNTNR